MTRWTKRSILSSFVEFERLKRDALERDGAIRRNTEIEGGLFLCSKAAGTRPVTRPKINKASM